MKPAPFDYFAPATLDEALGLLAEHAGPSAELPEVMLALEARFRAQGSTGERSIPAAEFFKGMLETALAPGELLIEIALPPLPSRSGTAFLEVARRHGDYALVGVAGVVTLDPRGRCQSARIACLSVGDGPVLLIEAGKLLAGQSPSEELLRAAADAAATRDIDPPSDIHASAAYRRQLVAVLTRRALARAFERAGSALYAPEAP